MFKERLHKFRTELKDEARRIGTKFKEEFLDNEKSDKGDDNKIIPN